MKFSLLTNAIKTLPDLAFAYLCDLLAQEAFPITLAFFFWGGG